MDSRHMARQVASSSTQHTYVFVEENSSILVWETRSVHHPCQRRLVLPPEVVLLSSTRNKATMAIRSNEDPLQSAIPSTMKSYKRHARRRRCGKTCWIPETICPFRPTKSPVQDRESCSPPTARSLRYQKEGQTRPGSTHLLRCFTMP